MTGREKRPVIAVLFSRQGSSMRFTNIVLIGLTVICVGCGSPTDQTPTVGVKGTVTLGGKPLEGADVYFINGQYSGSGKTDATGVYTLSGGAVTGENTVYISKLSVPEGAAGSDGAIDEGQLMAMAGDPSVSNSKTGPKQLVPAKYSDPGKTELKFAVPDSGAEAADFALDAK